MFTPWFIERRNRVVSTSYQRRTSFEKLRSRYDSNAKQVRKWQVVGVMLIYARSDEDLKEIRRIRENKKGYPVPPNIPHQYH